MNAKNILSTSIVLGLGGLIGNAQFLINEIRIDQPGGDVDEYFEIFGAPSAALTGLSYVVLGDGTGASGVIESVTSLDAFSLNSSGFFLGAQDPLTMTIANVDAVDVTLQFENSDNVTHLLVSGFTGTNGDDLDADDDGVLDVLPWTTVLDAVSLIETTDVPTSGEFYYAAGLGGTVVGPDGTFTPGHVYRSPDGGAWQIGAFDPASLTDTAGVSNVPEPSTYAALFGLMGLGLVLLRRRKA